MMLNRRQFLTTSTALALANAPWMPSQASTRDDKLTIMIYLKAGNDAYNTLVPFTQPRYYKMRPNIAQKRESLIHLNDTHGLHQNLAAIMPLWRDKELAIVQGIGQADVTNQHYRDAETLFTASGAEQFLDEGWVTRARAPTRVASVANKSALDVFAFGDLDIREADPMGPFRGGKLGVINVAYPSEWLARRNVAQTAFLASPNAAEIAKSFALAQPRTLKTVFPTDSFGQAIQASVELAAAGMAPPVIHITLNAEDGDHHHAFDTHWDQLKYHGAALERLAEGMSALRAGLQEIGAWDKTLVFTYDEFGRSPKENEKQGTHHGWASVHFVAGGRIKGGLYGEPMPVVNVFQIDGPPPVIDYRALYTSIIESHWGGNANGVFQKRFKGLDILKS